MSDITPDNLEPILIQYAFYSFVIKVELGLLYNKIGLSNYMHTQT